MYIHINVSKRTFFSGSTVFLFIYFFQFRSFYYSKCSSGQPAAASCDGKCTDCIFFSLNFLFHVGLIPINTVSFR